MIREATPGDLPALLVLGRAYFVEAGHDCAIDRFDPPSFAKTLSECHDCGLLRVAEADGHIVGMIGARVAASPFNNSVLLARTIFLYSRPDYRRGIAGELLRSIEDAA